MAKPIALNLTGMAKDVWKGMSEGVNNGRRFEIKGNKTAKQALSNINRRKSLERMSTMKLANTSALRKTSLAQRGGDFIGGGARETMKNMKRGENITTALKNAHSNPGGGLNMKRVAGSYVGASAAARVATGGGVMKDKNGNTNLIGIPFI